MKSVLLPGRLVLILALVVSVTTRQSRSCTVASVSVALLCVCRLCVRGSCLESLPYHAVLVVAAKPPHHGTHQCSITEYRRCRFTVEALRCYFVAYHYY